jgi:hypothetical protein
MQNVDKFTFRQLIPENTPPPPLFRLIVPDLQELSL